MAMDPYVKRRWVEALRSGRYKQGDGELVSDNGAVRLFCCLGVLDTEMSGAAAYGKGELIDAGIHHRYGLSAEDEGNAITWNDQDRLSFDEIAARIEAGKLDGVPLEGGV